MLSSEDAPVVFLSRVFRHFFDLYAKPDSVAGHLGFGFVCLFSGLTTEYTE